MSQDLTTLFAAYRAGDAAALEAVVPLVYDELRRLARSYLSREPDNHTLQATALANEAYLKLAAGNDLGIQDRTHFFALAGRQMRQILVDHARAKFADKRGGRARPIQFNEAAHVDLAQNPQLLDLDDALTALATQDQRQAHIVELRFFGGLSMEQTAQALECSLSTVKRDWVMARAWLSREMDRASG